jgi:hypothetical protein
MQTIEFSERLANIIKTLQADAILQQLTVILREPAIVIHTDVNSGNIRANFPALLFKANANLQALSNDPFNKQIISSLGFEEVFNVQSLATMVTAVNATDNTSQIRAHSSYHPLFTALLIGLKNLYAFQKTIDTLLIQPSKKAIGEGESALEFEIIDFGNGIAMERFENMLKTIHSLHDTVARALELEGRLAIAYLDSGSNSIISIKSDHRIIDSLRKLISEIWDKIRFGKFDNMHRKLEAAEAGLKFVELVDAQQTAGKISPDAAAQLKHLAIAETINLFEKGTSLREIQTQTTIDNRSLLLEKFEIKQIGTGTAIESNKPESSPKTNS